jgi:hypothetical protein
VGDLDLMLDSGEEGGDDELIAAMASGGGREGREGGGSIKGGIGQCRNPSGHGGRSRKRMLSGDVSV